MRLFDVDFFKPAEETTYKYPIEWALVHEPNLWVPGKSPVGAVKIDYENPLTRGMLACWVWKDLSNGHDLVSGLTVEHLGDTPTTIERGAIRLNGSAGTSTDNGIVRTNIKVNDIKSAGAIMHRFTARGTQPSQRYFLTSHDGVSYGELAIAFTSDVDSSIRVNDSFADPANHTKNIFDGGTHTILGSWDHSLPMRYTSVDGEIRQVTSSWTESTPTGEVAFGARSAPATDDDRYAPLGIYEITVIWERYIPQHEATQLSIDPYQFLIPA